MVMVEKENEELKSRLLKLELTDVMCDAQISGAYQTLCANIMDWVDTHLGNIDDLVDCLQCAVQNEGYGAVIMQFVDNGLWASVQAHKAPASFFLNCVVQRFVMSQILTRYASCVPLELTKSIRMIEQQMLSSNIGK